MHENASCVVRQAVDKLGGYTTFRAMSHKAMFTPALA